MSDEVTKELFASKFEDLKEFIGVKFDNNRKEHKELNANQKYTNGRVKRLEIWKAYMYGAWAVIALVFPVLFIYMMNSMESNLERKIDVAIEENNNKYFEE